ncbi:hypothetical protein KUTeg_011808 [Tegillarca granosa]|uniref:Uncharacterized protein n=1 Tax=Tegillarca granosa TaxID=220873 RepID=A0ABQ9F308_TEGGR|nr:hypothetical protein KUTeg_011808 [Tegillarca granosa]
MPLKNSKLSKNEITKKNENIRIRMLICKQFSFMDKGIFDYDYGLYVCKCDHDAAHCFYVVHTNRQIYM